MAQYGRRNNVVFSGIPENVPDNNLESTVISVLSDIDVQVEPRDIEACHQIGKPTSKTQKTIVRFVNRKNCEKVLANKKKLLKLNNEKHNFHAGTNIFVNENLTPMNETIAFNCRKLKHSGLIHACYSRNGIVYIKANETSRTINVFHLGKLISFFPDHLQNNDENDQYHDVSICITSFLCDFFFISATLFILCLYYCLVSVTLVRVTDQIVYIYCKASLNIRTILIIFCQYFYGNNIFNVSFNMCLFKRVIFDVM